MGDYTKRVWTAVAAVAVVALAAWVLGFLLYGVLIIFAGVLFAVFLEQLSVRVARWTDLSYGAAFGIVVSGLAALALATIIFMGAQLMLQAAEFVSKVQEAGTSLLGRLQQQPWWGQVRQFTRGAEDTLSTQEAVATATTAVTTVFGAIGGAVLTIILAFYIALKPEWYRGGLLTLVPPQKRNRVREVLELMGETLWYWFLGRLVGMLVIGVGYAIGLWIIGVPMAVSLGVFAGLMDFIPNIGPLIGLVPVLLFAMQQGGTAVLWVLVLYLVLQTFEAYLLTPLIEQRQVALPPGLTLSNQLLFGLWAGFLGLLLATPIAVVVSTLLREFYVKDVLGSGPAAELRS